ncbi:ABC transporter ATP-binding protein YtrE [Rubripirellula tenax]|uniref:ABC transporter ATP-binding protein YtrE n=1 Tax=Rubripirellula tenax TaxID=2528015 RepID=A0A5C6FHF2_9BACT|nr:ABC transporter ATP-binding protein [Rubripirellula tenax]TWU59973.1 ABC transporter ATP-binding protein YtrE [Rubripirellula tenax]
MNASETPQQPTVLVQDVCKQYRRGDLVIPVLQDMNLQLEAGDYTALMGPSGSGKSTLLNLIAGLDQPTSGHIYVCGEDLAAASQSALAKWRSRHVGFIFQMYNLIPVLTAYENVELPLTLTPLNRKQRRAQVETALEIVGLSDRKDHYPTQLSGGQEQRVSIARAIATDPTLIVADEPTGDLDAKSGAEILELMRRLNEEFGKTIVMVTHDPRAAACAKRTLQLLDGRLVGDSQVDSKETVV